MGPICPMVRNDMTGSTGSQLDQVPVIDELTIDLRLDEKFNGLDVFSPGEAPQAELEVSGESPRIRVRNIPLYSIILLKQ